MAAAGAEAAEAAGVDVGAETGAEAGAEEASLEAEGAVEVLVCRSSETTTAFLRKPDVLAALQRRLQAQFLKFLPPSVQRRIHCLKNLQRQVINLEAKFYEEVHFLEKKYHELSSSLYEKRAEIIKGTYEPTEEESDFPLYEKEDEDTEAEDSCPSGYERMKCSCLDAGAGGGPSACASYERLPSAAPAPSPSPSAAALPFDARLSALRRRDDAPDKDCASEKEEELVFFNDDGSYQTAVVERNLCAADLCQLLALKNRVAKDVNWTIVEHWLDFGLERNLEDHEEVLSVHWDMQRSFGRHSEKRFVFRKDFRKYEFFHNPQQFFPADMVDMAHCEELANAPPGDQVSALQALLLNSGECPPIFSHVWVREANKQVWNKAFLLLKHRRLYLSYKIQVVAKFLRSKDGNSSCGGPSKDRGSDAESLQVFANLTDYSVYTTLNAKNQFRAPTEFGLFLRPTGAAAAAAAAGGEDAGLRCLACESERARLCWLTAMRLAKYGKQLRENYRAFKNKQVESSSPKEYNSYTVPNESVRSRVAMDFTGSVGRIVEDPQEAKAIAVAEGYSWKRRWRPAARHAASAAALCRLQGLDSGVHMAQPWFHSGMSRDQAAQLVARHGTVDGVFLVRESRSNPGSFVLTFKCGTKVLHTQIQPVMDPVREALCYSLDSGVTKFYDLLQLVEFYQLNAGCLPTRLTHYVVQSTTGNQNSDKSASHSPSSF